MADLPTFSRGREPAAARWHRHGALLKEVFTRFAWFAALSTLLLASCIMTIVSLLSIKTTADGAARKGSLDNDNNDNDNNGGGQTLWLLCLIVPTTLSSVAAAAMVESLGKSRSRDWCGASLMMAVSFVCAVLILPVHLAVSAYWGEVLGRICIFLVSVLFCLTAIRLATKTARETGQPAADVNLEER
ncbi:hypothetical protein RB595_001482 [Gaeumannomyces hyphopodioides]